MAEDDLFRLRPSYVAKIWGTAFGQLIDLWRAAMAAPMELGSGEQRLPSGQVNRFSVRSADGSMPRLTARNLVGEAFQQPLDGSAVVFAQTGSGPGSVTVECSIDERFQPIQGDTYHGQVVSEDGTVVATVNLAAGS
jgi:hypothetical protein